MREIKNFITAKDADYLIKMIDQNSFQSQVVSTGKKLNKYDETARTSSTANLFANDPVVSEIHKKISNYLGIPINRGESLQGQKYEVGQYFHNHTDYFEGSHYDQNCLVSGNRTHTLMIYLNDDFEGGETGFPKKKRDVKPEKCKAVAWKNMERGKVEPNSLHSGKAVKEGIKYIVTSWWRERTWDGGADFVAYNNMKNDNLHFTNHLDIPQLSKTGFKIIQVPKDIWRTILDTYELLKHSEKIEIMDNKNEWLGGEIETTIMDLNEFKSIVEIIHEELKSVHEEWVNYKLEPSFIYGIRSYKRGSTLVEHRDRVETHHISSIICVDKDLEDPCGDSVLEDWALNIQDHNGVWHNIILQVGQMLLYESAKCLHGRTQEFKGNYFNNMFVHYKLSK